MKKLCEEGGIDEEELRGFAPQPWPRRLRVSAPRVKNLRDNKWKNSTMSPSCLSEPVGFVVLCQPAYRQAGSPRG